MVKLTITLAANPATPKIDQSNPACTNSGTAAISSRPVARREKKNYKNSAAVPRSAQLRLWNTQILFVTKEKSTAQSQEQKLAQKTSFVCPTATPLPNSQAKSV